MKCDYLGCENDVHPDTHRTYPFCSNKCAKSATPSYDPDEVSIRSAGHIMGGDPETDADRNTPTLLDQYVMAALAGGYGAGAPVAHIVANAYAIARAAMAERPS